MLEARTGRRGGASIAGGAGLDGRRRKEGAVGVASSVPASRAPPNVTDRFTSA